MPTLLGEKDAAALGGEELVQKNKIWSIQENFNRTYYVLADNTSQNESVILATPGIPPVLSLISGSSSWCRKRQAKEVTTIGAHPVTGVRTILWSVQCDFSSEVDVEDASSSISPEDKTPKVRWYGEIEEEPLEQDAVTGEPVVNAVGEAIEISGPVATIILEVRRYELPPFDPDTALAYGNRVNSEEFYGAPEGTAWLQPIQVSEEKVINGVKVIEVNYLIKFKMRDNPESGSSAYLPNTWDASPPNRGLQYLETAGSNSGKLLPYTDQFGNRIQGSLAEDGTKLPKGEEEIRLRFARHGRANLNDLLLGPY